MGWVAGTNKIAVSEMTISHMINILRNFHKFSREARAGNWPSRREGTLLQEELWKKSDVLTIHVSRNQQTIGMYCAEVLDKLKPGVFIINTGREHIFDETALLERPKNERTKAAALDIFAFEPAIETPLYNLDNF